MDGLPATLLLWGEENSSELVPDVTEAGMFIINSAYRLYAYRPRLTSLTLGLVQYHFVSISDWIDFVLKMNPKPDNCGQLQTIADDFGGRTFLPLYLFAQTSKVYGLDMV